MSPVLGPVLPSATSVALYAPGDLLVDGSLSWGWLAASCGWAAVAVGLVSAWPQVLRMHRSGSTAGVSWASSVLTVGTFVVWAAYGVAIDDVVQTTHNLLALVAAVALCVLMARLSAVRTVPAVLGVLGIAVVAAAAWWFGGADLLAVLAAGMSLSRMAPQAGLVWRLGDGSTEELAGLCPWTSLLGLLAAVLWLGYGLLVVDLAVIVTSAVATVLCGIIVWRRVPSPGVVLGTLQASMR